MESLRWKQRIDSGLDRSCSGFSTQVLHRNELPRASVAAPNVYLGNHSPAPRKQRLQRLLHDLKPQCACDIPDHS